MNDRTRQNLLLFYAAGVLDADEQAAARRVLAADDPQVQAEWAHARSVVAHLTLAAGAVKAPKAAREMLMARVRGVTAQAEDVREREVLGTVGPRSGHSRWWTGAASALAAAAAVALAMWLVYDGRLTRQNGTLNSTQTALVEREQQLATLRERLALAERELQTVRSETQERLVELMKQSATLTAAEINLAEQNVKLVALRERLDGAERVLQTVRSETSRRVALKGGEPQPEASGYLVYNPQTRGVILLAEGFPPPPPGETMQLWVVTADERKVSVGTFEIAPDGRATLTTTLEADPGTVIVAAVTNEPRGGSPQPTGQFQMLGEF